MEIYGIKEPQDGRIVVITLQKLNESIGKIKIKASIENLSFKKAVVYVPITLDKNRQLIKTTKNGKPYIVPKYYLVYEFNETDPVFESEVELKEENFFKKIKMFLQKSLSLLS